jgi:uncharacterized membrane protein YeaQ/YmgE (transglycosylase-associated protein family)
MCLVIAVLVVAVLFAIYFLIALGTILAFLPWIVVGLIAGWAASVITESPHGILGDIIVGLAGSFIGSILYTILIHRPIGGVLSLTNILVAVVGSVILLAFVKVVAGTNT